MSLLVEEPDGEFEDLLKSLAIDVMPDASFYDEVDTSEMPINVQMKGWEDMLRKQYIEKVNADPDEIDISSDDSDLEDNAHIEAIEGENSQISFADALQIIDHIADQRSWTIEDFAFSYTDT